MKKMTLPDRFLHGGDYNPDQWLDQPEILEEDIRLMKQANVNSVTLGVFSWAKEEPEDGVYDLDWLEEIIDRLYENGISTILATPTAARPHWLAEKYEDTNMVTDQGIRRRPGFRSNFCPSSKTIYWATGCHWSNRPVIVRDILGLQDVISDIKVTHSGETNVYGHGFGNQPEHKDPVTGAYFLSEFTKERSRISREERPHLLWWML